MEAPAGDAFLRAWLEPPRPLRSLRGLKAHADPPGVAPASASILLIKVGELDYALASGYELLLSLKIG
ncbi:hypothetical protein CSV67_07820 [Sporosarcina sp. P2]|nr:hypothetical protein CSV67_07820 [Sporosarcina sp. P2]